MPEHEPEDDDIQLSMLENGLDFIASGLKHIASPVSKFDLKYAVLHLSAGIELVLKDRLMREDWKQIFVKPEDATQEKLKSGNFKSVNLYQCLERLEERCAVDHLIHMVVHDNEVGIASGRKRAFAVAYAEQACGCFRSESHEGLLRQTAPSDFGENSGQKCFQTGKTKQCLAEIFPPRFLLVRMMRSVIAPDGRDISAFDRLP